MLQKLITLIAQFSPPILFFGSISGFFGLVNLGPKELTHKHPLNRQLSYPIFLLSIGFFLFLHTKFFEIGIGVAMAGFFWYMGVMKKVRDVFPRTYTQLPKVDEKNETEPKSESSSTTKKKIK
jgi:hypothetical protein